MTTRGDARTRCLPTTQCSWCSPRHTAKPRARQNPIRTPNHLMRAYILDAKHHHRRHAADGNPSRRGAKRWCVYRRTRCRGCRGPARWRPRDHRVTCRHNLATRTGLGYYVRPHLRRISVDVLLGHPIEFSTVRYIMKSSRACGGDKTPVACRERPPVSSRNPPHATPVPLIP
jgi:hypothetical protein